MEGGVRWRVGRGVVEGLVLLGDRVGFQDSRLCRVWGSCLGLGMGLGMGMGMGMGQKDLGLTLALALLPLPPRPPPPLPLKADHAAPAEAIVLEASQEKGLGAVADVLVSWGRLHVGDFVVVGTQFGKVRCACG